MRDHDAVLAANMAFYDALEMLDLHAMTAVWLKSEHDVCIHPGWEVLTGWVPIRESWRTIFASTGYMRFEASDVRCRVSGDHAFITCVESIYSVIQGQTVNSRVACTNVYERDNGRWRLTLHHGSPIASSQNVTAIDPDGEPN